MSIKSKKRKTIFIKPAFQRKFIYWVVGLLLVCCLCSAGVLYPMISSELNSGAASGHLDISGLKSNLFLALLIGNGLAILVAALATTYVILYISHKVAGPLYRFEAICKEIGNGNLNVSTGLRDMDQLTGLSDAFGEMLVQLRSQCEDQHKRIEKARDDLSALSGTLSDQPASKKIIDTVDNQLASLAEDIKNRAGGEVA